MPNDLSSKIALARQTLVVIPALNEERHIAACVRSLMTGDSTLRDILVIVADGGSEDDTAAIVTRLCSEYPNLRLIRNPDRLQSAAVNLAAKTEASPATRYLIRCDAHSIYPANFILDVAQALVATGAASVVVPMDAIGETCFEKANAWIVDTPFGSGGSAHRGGTRSGYIDHGHHAGFDLSWFLRLGGYDPAFSHNEDAEYDTRLGRAGGKIWMAATTRIKYIPRGRVSALARQYFNYGKGRAQTVIKHRQRLKLRQAAPVFALLASMLGLLGGIFYWPLLILPIGYISLLVFASLSIAVSKKSVCGLWAGAASATMHMSWAAGFLKWVIFGRTQRSLK
jgi:succinoglycan biosynthesis protein ExoA